MPELKAIHEKLSPRGFDVVGISIDRDLSALSKFLEENELPWTTLAGQDATDFARRMGVRGIPTMLLIDRDGKVASIEHQVADLAGKAEMLLANAAK
jgi:peroxiredoxin